MKYSFNIGVKEGIMMKVNFWLIIPAIIISYLAMWVLWGTPYPPAASLLFIDETGYESSKYVLESNGFPATEENIHALTEAGRGVALSELFGILISSLGTFILLQLVPWEKRDPNEIV